MNDRATIRPITVSIAAVERDTGLSKDTLRVWERRYGFPKPERDTFGERAYPLEQIDKLRVVKRMLDAGHRPGRIVSMDIQALQALSESLSPAPQRMGTPESPDLRMYIDLIKSHDPIGLRRSMVHWGMRLGLTSLVCDVVAPLSVLVGDAWMRGQIEIFEEHMYTESVNVVLRQAIGNALAPEVGALPRVLLTTFPQEPHGLGLLMAETLLTLEGCYCISLGIQTPVWDIVLAAKAYRADVVALSFAASQSSAYVTNSLDELRQKLPRNIDIWVGGSCPALVRKPIGGIHAVDSLALLHGLVADCRSARS